MSRHSGKTVIITGGASGLGEAMSRRLAEEGAHVVITDIDLAAAERLASELGERATPIRHDVTSEEDWNKVITQVRQERGVIHGLVNNAGIAPAQDLMIPLAEWRKVMAVDLDGVFLGTQKAVAVMAEQDVRGAIINMSSAMAYVGQATTPAYSAAKAGVIGLTKSAVAYVSAHRMNIRINTIHPGTHETPILLDALPHLPEGFKEAELARHPVGHFGNPNGVAATVSFLLDDDAEFYQGAEFLIDGARLAVDR
ncbi:SDR family oxidoreductase [Georgenia sp. Marseille-Q6866]